MAVDFVRNRSSPAACRTTRPAQWRRSSESSSPTGSASPRSTRAAGPSGNKWTTTSCAEELAVLDFDHRVLKPWANNPAFYVTVFSEESDEPAREGPFARGAVELWTYPIPLSPEPAAQIQLRNPGDSGASGAGKKHDRTGNGRDL